MSIFFRPDIKSKRDLAQFLAALENVWKDISRIKDGRRRCKEVLKFKKEIKSLVAMQDKSKEMGNEIKKVLICWLKIHKD